MLREILKVLPEESYVYYADSAHCPYGEKSREYVIDRAMDISRTLLREGADIIVVACNTATAAAISYLREEWPQLPFVGMEPAVKPAALNTRSGVIGVLATAGTLKGSRYLDLREKYSDKVKVVEHVGQGFVELVEKGILDGPEAEDIVRTSVQPLLDEGADTIVLGCTHYPFLEDVIRRIAGPDVSIIDPAPAVAAQVLRLRKTGSGTPGIKVLSSKKDFDSGLVYRLLAKNSDTIAEHSSASMPLITFVRGCSSEG